VKTIQKNSRRELDSSRESSNSRDYSHGMESREEATQTTGVRILYCTSTEGPIDRRQETAGTAGDANKTSGRRHVNNSRDACNSSDAELQQQEGQQHHERKLEHQGMPTPGTSELMETPFSEGILTTV
jgi:hypothetical protein